MLIFLQSIVGFLSYFVMPKLEAIFNDFGVPLPSITVLTLEVTRVISAWWPLVLLFLCFQIGFLTLLSFSMFGALPWDLPWIGRLFLRRHSALVLRCLARMVEGDKPLSQGLSTLARTYPTRWIANKLKAAARDVDRGDDWRVALGRRGLIRYSDAVLLESAQRAGTSPGRSGRWPRTPSVGSPTGSRRWSSGSSRCSLWRWGPSCSWSPFPTSSR